MFFRRRLARPPAPASASRLSRLRDALAIVALVLGGVWAGVEFFWDKLIAPRLEAALVQISSAATIVGRTPCCVLAELEVKLHNSGRRDVYIHASHLAAGARRLEAVPLNAPRIADLNEEFGQRHRQFAAPGGDTLEPLYGAAGPAAGDYVLLLAGHLVDPGAKIAPGEAIVRRLALVVPADHPFVSVRAQAFVMHQAQASAGIRWNWTVAPQTLALQVVPWRAADLARFNELRECSLAANDQRAAACREEAQAGGQRLWDEFFRRDCHAYRQPHAMDFLAWREGGVKP
jgi:hypothetical protein